MKLIRRLEEVCTEVFNEDFTCLLQIEEHAKDENGFVMILDNKMGPMIISNERLYKEEGDLSVEGFSLGGLYTFDEFSSFVEGDIDKVIENSKITLDDFPIGYFRFLILNENRRGKASGFKLGLHSYNYLAKKTDFVGGLVWMYKNNKLVEIVENFPNCELLYTFEDYDIFENDEKCPFCNNKCNCSFRFYGVLNAEPYYTNF